MILTILGYLVLVVLAWAALDILVFTMAYAWQGGKAQAERRVTEEIQRWDDSLNSTEILRYLGEIAHRDKRILDLTETLLNVTTRMNKTMGELLQMETDVLREL